MDEAELLDRIKANPAVFSELFKLYYKPIFGYILRRVGNVDDTADLAADTFLNVYRHINSFSYKGISIKIWLYRIATNNVNLFFRNRRKHASLFERLDPRNRVLFSTYFQEDKKELEQELQRHVQFAEMLQMLKTLPVKYQEVISLRYFEGKDNKEIVQILDIKEGTLKSLLSRGVERLRKKCNQF